MSAGSRRIRATRHRASVPNEFGIQLKTLLRARRMRQKDAADLLGWPPQYLSQLVTGKRPLTYRSLQALATALKVTPDQLGATPVRTPALARLQGRLERGCERVGASSCTFYVADPFWPQEFRLAAMVGIKYPEPMHGLLWPESARRKVTGGPDEEFVRDPVSAAGIAPAGVPPRIAHLFGSFARRESVESVARVVHRDRDDNPDAILFVNFSSRNAFDDSTKAGIRELLAEVVTLCPSVQRELKLIDSDWVIEATKILSPELSVARLDVDAVSNRRGYFERILRTALDALGVARGFGLATLHLYDDEKQQLTLEASAGDLSYPERAICHSVARGEGIVSWVTLHRRALLIPDLDASVFREVHVRLNDAIKSEIAVPFDVNGELLGVLCLESPRRGQFRPHHVRSLWYAANRVAFIYELYHQSSLSRELLEICSLAAGNPDTATQALTRIARLATTVLKATQCHIFGFDPGSHTFDVAASSDHEMMHAHPRSSGFTSFVKRANCPLWISGIRSEREYSVQHLVRTPTDIDGVAGAWLPGFPADARDVPQALNDVTLVGRGIGCELGIPITVGDRCVGVAWVKYKRDRPNGPTGALLHRALGFSAQAGLVLDSIRRTRRV